MADTMTPRLYLLAALVACVLTAMGSASIARWHTLRGAMRDTAAAQAREHAAEERARAAEEREAQAREAQAAAEERERAAEALIAGYESERKRVSEETRRPVAPKVRAARVTTLTGVGLSGEQPSHGRDDVVSVQRDGRQGFWVSEPRMVLLEEALTLRPILEAELAATHEAHAAAKAQVEALHLRVVAVEDRARGWELAYEAEAAARTQAVAEATPALPGPVWGAGGAVVGAVVGGILARATCPDAVTVVR